MRMLLVSLLLAHGAQTVAGEQKTLISTDILYRTYELLGDTYSMAYKKADVDGLLKQVPMDDIKKAIDEQMKALPPQATQMLSEAQTMSVQVKGLAYEYLDKAYEPANAMAVNIIKSAEKAMPAYKGMVPHTLGNLVLFLIYACVVFYVLVKVALFALKFALGVFCCFCCCGCCRRRGGSKGAATNGKAKGKAKAAAATNGKAAAKPVAKKAAK